MSNQYFYTIIIAFLLGLSSCSDIPKNVKQTLKLAGDNKVELQKVIDHYQAPEDSLKLKAAYFLIGNMSGHYYFELNSRSLWEKTLELSYSLIRIGHPNYEEEMRNAYQYNIGGIQYAPHLDIQEIKAKDLIENIDLAFKVWPKPWNDFLDFDGFCNYILPYRIKNEPYDIGFRKNYYAEKESVMDSYSNSSNTISEFANKFPEFEGGWKYFKLDRYDLSATDIEKGRMADCVDHSILQGSIRHSMGIPSVLDQTFWPNKNGSHYWNAIMYHKDSSIVYNDFFWSKPGAYEMLRKPANIFRTMYAKQDQSLAKQEKDLLKIPPFFRNPYLKDVTKEYLPMKKVSVDLKTSNGEILKYAYLCMFNDRTWKPVSWVRTHEQKQVDFELISDNIYTVLYYENEQWIGASDAFIVDKYGGKKMFKPIKDSLDTIQLYRKSKMRNAVKQYAERLRGAKFQLSNSSNFEKAVTIYEITDSTNLEIPQEIEINVDRPYKYVRLVSGSNKLCDMGELAWFSGKEKLKGNVIGSQEHGVGYEREKAFDGDLLTFFAAKEPPIKDFRTWIGLGLDKKEKITKLMFSPRDQLAERLRGAKFQLANLPNFKDAITVYQITEAANLETPKEIKIKVDRPYKYVRLLSDLNKLCDVGELAWFSGKEKLKGNVIGSQEYVGYEREKAFDGDLSTFFAAAEPKNFRTWIGLGLDKKEKITKLMFSPRSDVNFVKPGDIYELFYWDGKWISLGQKIASKYLVEYTNVPKNALFWFRNLSEGIEEHLFTIKNGKQIFY